MTKNAGRVAAEALGGGQKGKKNVHGTKFFS